MNPFSKKTKPDTRDDSSKVVPKPALPPEEPEVEKLSAAEEEYLSRLANTVLGRQPMPYKERRAGTDRHIVRPGNTPMPLDPRRTPMPVPPQATPLPLQATPRPIPGGRHTPMPIAGARRTVAETPVPVDGTFAVGTILAFEDNSIGIFKDRRSDKDYEVVYLLKPDGRVSPQGLALENYDLKVLGVLPLEFVMRLQRRKRWERDEIIYHLDTFDYCALVPHPVPGTTTPAPEGVPMQTPAPAAEEKRTLVLGRRIT
ncbi:MAG: hypothetical protein KF858_12180, partial [Candidatus Sumerlaeia bacterium]|nr:hypothetical protein [Candidatus Sumerlaeia bacterium]